MKLAFYVICFFLIASGICRYFEGQVTMSLEAGQGSLFKILSLLPLRLGSFPAIAYQMILGSIFNVQVEVFTATSWQSALQFIWPLPIIAVGMLLFDFRGSIMAGLIPIIAVFVPGSKPWRARRNRAEAKALEEETARSKLSTELDDTLAELERTKHKLRRAKERRD